MSAGARVVDQNVLPSISIWRISVCGLENLPWYIKMGRRLLAGTSGYSALTCGEWMRLLLIEPGFSLVTMAKSFQSQKTLAITILRFRASMFLARGW